MERIRKGDEVVVITGKDKGKRGTVLRRADSDHLVVERSRQRESESHKCGNDRADRENGEEHTDKECRRQHGNEDDIRH